MAYNLLMIPGFHLHSGLSKNTGDSPLKVFREYRGLTQAALAELAGISRLYLSQIETGRRGGSVKTLRALAKALDVELDDVAA